MTFIQGVLKKKHEFQCIRHPYIGHQRAKGYIYNIAIKWHVKCRRDAKHFASKKDLDIKHSLQIIYIAALVKLCSMF